MKKKYQLIENSVKSFIFKGGNKTKKIENSPSIEPARNPINGKNRNKFSTIEILLQKNKAANARKRGGKKARKISVMTL